MNKQESQSVEVKYKVMSDLCKPEFLPEYATSGAAGMDLHACIPEPWHLHPAERKRVPTGIAFQFPGPFLVGLVYARSGLAWRHGIGLPNGVGVIDSDYTGEVMVLLTNFSDDEFTIQPGDRIAQIVFQPVYSVQLTETETLDNTQRGDKGFGSTGVKGGQDGIVGER